MSTPLDQPKFDHSQSGSAAQWGLASLLMGGLFILMAMLELQLNMQLFVYSSRFSIRDARQIHDSAMLAAIILPGLTITSIAFGIRGVALAYKRAQPCALAWAGVLMSTLALALWFFTFYNLFDILDMMIRFHGGF